MEHSVRTYLIVWAALLLLFAITWGSAYIHLGTLSTAINLTIAVAKALLVIIFFMHIHHSSPVVRIFAAAGFFWLTIMFTLTLGDYLTRG